MREVEEVASGSGFDALNGRPEAFGQGLENAARDADRAQIVLKRRKRIFERTTKRRR